MVGVQEVPHYLAHLDRQTAKERILVFFSVEVERLFDAQAELTGLLAELAHELVDFQLLSVTSCIWGSDIFARCTLLSDYLESGTL